MSDHATAEDLKPLTTAAEAYEARETASVDVEDIDAARPCGTWRS